jgi:uncharacterized membrane protein YhaH (DUF805 family)
MHGKIDWSELFFSADGRVARMPFIVAGALLIVLLSLYESVVFGNEALHWLTGVFVYGFLIFTGVCVLSKRLHDRGRSGWWSPLIILAFILVWPYPSNFWDVVGMIFLIWAFVELALMPGEQGANRFGPNPQRPPATPAPAA